MIRARRRPARADLRATALSMLTAAALGAIAGITTPVVLADPRSAGAAAEATGRLSGADPPLRIAAGPPAAVARTSLPFIVFPSAARPGEVVHVRESAAGAVPAGIVVGFAFASDPGHQSIVQADQAGHIRADLVVPPGTAWGRDPIVVSVGGTPRGIAVVGNGTAFQVAGQLPFVASRSAQPPLWNR